MIANPYVLLALLVSFILSNGYAYYIGGEHTENRIKAEQLEATNKAIVQADVQAVKDNTVIKFVEVEKEVIKTEYRYIREKANENIDKNPVYAECGLDDDGLRIYNASASTKKDSTGKPTN